MVFSKTEVTNLLKKIKNPEDRKIAKRYLQELIDIKSGKLPRSRTKTKAAARRALDFLIKAGLKIGEHALIEKFLDLFD